jgi:hypothetical protein
VDVCFPHGGDHRDNSYSSLFIWTLISPQGPHLHDLPNSDGISKAPSLDTITLGLRISANEFGEGYKHLIH